MGKIKKSSTNLYTKLPQQYKNTLGAFNSTDLDKLPLLQRLEIDYKIDLIFENNKEFKVFWGPLYNILYNKLLMLQQMLIEYLNKGFIQINNSSAAALVLFVQKPRGGLQFCVNY